MVSDHKTIMGSSKTFSPFLRKLNVENLMCIHTIVKIIQLSCMNLPKLATIAREIKMMQIHCHQDIPSINTFFLISTSCEKFKSLVLESRKQCISSK